ncbi:cystathionine beta-lyase/cystathionine gamma-synthase [Lysinibacillus fusiformis]|uniref:cystathionine beta-lyase/cystathionine gamma-synthase n=1 Tax=Lysinibacillus fusiformis TaxID=28031 RepID=UPI002E1B1A1E|nr:cystathionine beta-lyase/cystathionine gamma-synthase [Lysinibacillus fusiformis]
MTTAQLSNSINSSKPILNATTLQQIKMIHRNTDGFITLFQKKSDGTKRQYHYKVNQLTPEMLNRDGWIDFDTFISLNSFFIPKRSLDCLRKIQCCFVDIDCYKRGYSIEETIQELETKHFGQTMPIPNMIIYSGQGIQLLWTIQFMSGLAVSRWNDLQNGIANKLKYLGADLGAKDASRVFRLAGTFNSKLLAKGYEASDCIVTCDILHQEEKSFHQITERYFPELYKASIRELSDLQKERVAKRQSKKERAAKRKVKYLFTPYSLMAKRLMDLFKLAKIRSVKKDTCREYMMFLCRYFSLQLNNDKDQAIQKMRELNSLFVHPMKESEFLNDTKSAEKYHEQGGILLKNETIIDWLGINELEQREMSTLISKKEKNRRKALKNRKDRHDNGAITSGQYNRKRKLTMLRAINKFYLLHKQYPNLSLSQYAKKLGVVKSTILKYLKVISSKSFSDLYALVMSGGTPSEYKAIHNKEITKTMAISMITAALITALDKENIHNTNKERKLLLEFEKMLEQVYL